MPRAAVHVSDRETVNCTLYRSGASGVTSATSFRITETGGALSIAAAVRSEHGPSESEDRWVTTAGEVGVFAAASFLTEEGTAGRGRSAATISSTSRLLLWRAAASTPLVILRR